MKEIEKKKGKKKKRKKEVHASMQTAGHCVSIYELHVLVPLACRKKISQ